MAAIARRISRVFPTSSDDGSLQVVVTFSCLGLLVSLALAILGFDPTPGSF